MSEKFSIREKSQDRPIFYHKSSEKAVFITTNGCSENRYDCAKMQHFFLKSGWKLAESVKEADIILFNSCGLTTVQENASIAVLREMNAIKKESAEVIVWGCFPKINETRIRKVHDGKVFSHDEAEHLENIFESNINSQKINTNILAENWADHYSKHCRSGHLNNINDFSGFIKKWAIGYVAKEAQDLVSFVGANNNFIKISTGCLNSCSYCGVRYARGRVKSKSVQEVNDLFECGLAKGYNRFTLIGTDLGSYGMDQGTNLIALLKTLLKHSGNYKIRLPNINARWLIKMLPGFIDVVSTGRIEVIGSAVQSGSNQILTRMNRLHSVEDYKYAITELFKAFPDLKVRTNIIVGFPGETRADFRETIQLIKDIDFTYADVHRYAIRPGTIAAKMKDQVPSTVVKLRYCNVMKIFALKYLKRKYRNKWSAISKVKIKYGNLLPNIR